MVVAEYDGINAADAVVRSAAVEVICILDLIAKQRVLVLRNEIPWNGQKKKDAFDYCLYGEEIGRLFRGKKGQSMKDFCDRARQRGMFE